MKKPLVLQMCPEGLLCGGSEEVAELRGQRCCDVVAATTLDGEPVCSADCSPARISPDMPVRVRGSVVRMTCTETTEGHVVWLAPTTCAVALTGREREVLRHVAQGRTTSEIARQLGIRPSTVRTHVEHTLDKLGASTRAEAVMKAHESGQLG